MVLCPRRSSHDTGAWEGVTCRKPAAQRAQTLAALGGCRLMLLDAFSERVAHEARELDRRTDLTLGLFQCLRHALARVVDIGLIEEADLLVECLEPGLDNLVDDIGGLSLRPKLVGKHILFARD